MSNLNRDELLKRLEAANDEVEKLKVELAEEQRRSAIYSEGLRVGTDLMLFKKGLVDAGLTDKQAFSLIMHQLKGATV